MQPDELLDVLLAARDRADGGQDIAQADDTLTPLLDAVDRLETLSTAEPDPAFRRALEARMLVRAEALATAGLGGRSPAFAGPAPVMVQAKQFSERGAAADVQRAADGNPGRARFRWGSRTRFLWPAAAAVLALAIGGGALTAAAHAQPGSPLFGVRQLEQNVQVSLASSEGDRVRLHLTYAGDALTALEAVVGRRGGDPAYAAALNTLRDEDQAAAAGLAELPAGSERDGLTAQLDALRTRERENLRMALVMLGWPDRIATTLVLGQAADTVPTVTSVTIGRTDVTGSGSGGEGDGRSWQVVVQGTGFQPGAVLLVHGAPTGTVIRVSQTELQAVVDNADLSGSIGVGNPDGTAAVVTRVSRQDQQEGTPGPGAQPTATPTRDHGTGGGGGDGEHGGAHGGTPTPSPTMVPGAGS